MQTYPLRDALVDVLDRYENTPVDEVMDALLSLLVAHVVAEGLDPVRFVNRVRSSIDVIAQDAGRA